MSAGARPRLGFLGVGWIGRARLEALAREDIADVVAVADPDAACAQAALRCAAHATIAPDLDALLALPLDGVVVATPSALHAAQVLRALDAGLAVFCQKPLGRTAAEVRRIGAAARAADRLVGVDLSYRHTAGMQRIRELVRAGELGRIYAIDLVFHNAYGPDKPWFRDIARAGGGCVIDLGIHLADLALWVLDFPPVARVGTRRYAEGRLLAPGEQVVEDHAIVQLELAGDVTVRLACSWNLSAGQDAVIEARFDGTRGAAQFRNVDGSFYDFVAERLDGTRRMTIASPPDAWGPRALVAWARTLAHRPRFDEGFAEFVAVAHVLDRIYGR
ncbi:MAG: Gfo/Idh/MocA family protein [Lautropia sp.]